MRSYTVVLTIRVRTCRRRTTQHPLLRVPFVAECYKDLSLQLKLSTDQPDGLSCDPTAKPDTMPVHLMPRGITEGPPTPVRYISIFYSGTGILQRLVGLQFGYDDGLSALLGKTHDLAGKPYHRHSYLLLPNEHILEVRYVTRQFSDKPRFITHIAFNTTRSLWYNSRPLCCSCTSDPGYTDCKQIQAPPGSVIRGLNWWEKGPRVKLLTCPWHAILLKSDITVPTLQTLAQTAFESHLTANAKLLESHYKDMLSQYSRKMDLNFDHLVRAKQLNLLCTNKAILVRRLYLLLEDAKAELRQTTLNFQQTLMTEKRKRETVAEAGIATIRREWCAQREDLLRQQLASVNSLMPIASSADAASNTLCHDPMCRSIFLPQRHGSYLCLSPRCNFHLVNCGCRIVPFSFRWYHGGTWCPHHLAIEQRIHGSEIMSDAVGTHSYEMDSTTSSGDDDRD